ncbi:ABC transporter ATP-binding protein [Xanthobacter sp. KR7-65]|uniref:ABC transporter ATP-binding protein n=1 Tax=Xanthobacter sp. KR7-65 TaxID=3156612 RepID=UPI0032B48B6F
MNSGPILSVQGLTCRFGGLVAVNNVDMAIQEGEIRALIGPNGAGKSTTLNLITGIYRPDSGSVSMAGQSLVGLRPSKIARAGVARTFQTIRLWKQMTLLENVMVGHQCRTEAGLFDILLRTRTARSDEARTRAEAHKALQLVGLGERAGWTASSLSYGQQRRLEIARALATLPKVLLLDEPAAGMNPQEVNDLVQQILAIRNSGVTVVLIEHNMPLVMRIADEITVLSFGKKIAEGRPFEIRENPEVISAYLGRPDDDAAA